MRMRSLALVVGLGLAASPGARAQERQEAPAAARTAPAQDKLLGLGDPAPPLALGKFVKGEPVAKFEPGKVYVIEFWATWCGPCRATAPHLSQLQQRYAAKGVTVIGVDAFEEDVDLVEPFVKEMGDKMAYAVALDRVPAGKPPTDGAMARTWMDAAGQGGIPTAFLIDPKGRIAWIGHPMELDEPLEQVVAGTYDLKAAIAAREAAQATEKQLTELMTKLQQTTEPAELKALLPDLEKLIQGNAELAPQLTLMRFTVELGAGLDDQAARTAGTLLAGPIGANDQACNNIAWTIVDPERPGKPSPALLKVAALAAEKAVKASGGKDAAILDTQARTQFLQGDVAKAVATQEQAIKIAGDAAGDDMKARLAEYRQAGK